jgi:hypothetical protein
MEAASIALAIVARIIFLDICLIFLNAAALGGNVRNTFQKTSRMRPA